MYANPTHKKRNETKLRLNDDEERMLLRCAARCGVQKAVWVRMAVEEKLARECAIPDQDRKTG